MKKTICMILAFVLAFSCCTAMTVGAAEDEDSTRPVYLLGDVDLDETVTVLDATDIQRDLAGMEELNGLQKELASITSEGMDIISAAMIQRHIASIPTGYAIGEPAGDENEGIVYEEIIPWNTFSPAGIITIPNSTCFSTAYPDVAFVTDKQVISEYTETYRYTDVPDPIEEASGQTHTYILENGTSIQFDYENKVMYFSDLTTTLTMNGAMSYNPFGPMTVSETQLFKMNSLDRYYGGEPMMVTYAYDEVPMLRHGDDILIPLQSFSDLFFSPLDQYLQYNGKGVFVVSRQLKDSEAAKEYCEMYTDVEPRKTISKEWAQVNYYELCNALDVRYGLQAAHNIVSFDRYFSRKGIKAKMLSGDLMAIEKATMEISQSLFEDFHSSPTTSSPFLADPIEMDISMFSPLFGNRVKKMALVKNTRDAVLGEAEPYERRGDTVFITFDSFGITGIDKSSQEGYEPTPYGDTVDLFAYALNRLKNEDSDAKNVVIDISCNGGGAVISCGYVLQAICGKSIICLQNPNTWALHQCVYDFDLNLDGEFDQNDVSMLDMGFNVTVITSDASFSCGNLLPCSLDALDDRILLIGQTSGGGACEVGYLSTSTGAIMQISSEYRLVTMKNGYIRDIDAGVAPDVYLSLNRMFDRDYIVDLVNEQFG